MIFGGYMIDFGEYGVWRAESLVDIRFEGYRVVVRRTWNLEDMRFTGNQSGGVEIKKCRVS